MRKLWPFVPIFLFGLMAMIWGYLSLATLPLVTSYLPRHGSLFLGTSALYVCAMTMLLTRLVNTWLIGRSLQSSPAVHAVVGLLMPVTTLIVDAVISMASTYAMGPLWALNDTVKWLNVNGTGVGAVITLTALYPLWRALLKPVSWENMGVRPVFAPMRHAPAKIGATLGFCVLVLIGIGSWHKAQPQVTERPIGPSDLTMEVDPKTGEPLIGIPRYSSPSGKYQVMVIEWGKMTMKRPDSKEPGNETKVMVVRTNPKEIKNNTITAVRITDWVTIPTQVTEIEWGELDPKTNPGKAEVGVAFTGSDGFIYLLAAREGRNHQLHKLDPKTKKPVSTKNG